MARLVVVALNGLCGLVDRFAYHPAVIRATRVLPRWWRCDLGRLAVLLDDKWESGTGGTIPAPSAAMDAKRPRQTDLVLGPLHALGCYTVKEAMPISTRRWRTCASKCTPIAIERASPSITYLPKKHGKLAMFH